MSQPSDLDEHRQVVREIAQRQIAPYVAEAEARREIPDQIHAAMARGGCFGLTLPPEFGGGGRPVRSFAVQQEELSRVWPTAAVAATWNNLSGRLIAGYGTPRQKSDLLPQLATGRMTGAVAWTEPHGGSDAAGIRSTAVRGPGGWVLNGGKRLIDNAQAADFLIVSARTDPDAEPRKGISMFVVRPDDDGYRFGGAYETLGLRAAGVGRFTLEDCFVPDDRLLGTVSRGFYQMMDMVELGRTGVAAICLGISEAALSAAMTYLTGRTAFGRRLSDNDAVLATVADLRVRLDAARLLTERAADLMDAGVPCASEAAMAKLYSSELARDVAATALRLHGGIGYTSETPLELFVRDSHAFTLGEGTSEVMRMIIGRTAFARVQADDAATPP